MQSKISIYLTFNQCLRSDKCFQYFSGLDSKKNIQILVQISLYLRKKKQHNKHLLWRVI